jgi:translation initiation factor 1A
MGNNDDSSAYAGEEIGRVRLPEDDEIFGILLRKLGYGKYEVYCADGNERICSVPGSKQRGMWLDVNDIVLVELWPVEGDEKGHIIWKYKKAAAQWLKNQGHVTELEEFL